MRLDFTIDELRHLNICMAYARAGEAKCEHCSSAQEKITEAIRLWEHGGEKEIPLSPELKAAGALKHTIEYPGHLTERDLTPEEERELCCGEDEMTDG